MSFLNLFYILTLSLSSIATENEPIDNWDEDEPILTPDGDDEVNKYCLPIENFVWMNSSIFPSN